MPAAPSASSFAGDLITLFVFWEMMAIGSTLVILCGGKGSEHAAFRYAALHLLGGVLLMAGIAGEIQATGSVAFGKLDASTVSRCLILAGFLINAGAPPLSAWLPDAYPQASWSGMVFLSAFTTKTAVYVLIRGFPGTELLIWIGLFMVFYGIIYAILENDMRRILAYSIVNQVGFMVTGIGIGTEMALNGAAAHAFTHIIYKALLLMSAGSVLLHDRAQQVHGPRRAVPHHAGDNHLRHRRGAGDLVIPLHLGLRLEVDGDARRRRPASGHRVVPADGGIGGRVPPCRHQVPVVRVLPEGWNGLPGEFRRVSSVITDPMVSWPAPGRPARWRSG